jgi:hypothetical protein
MKAILEQKNPLSDDTLVVETKNDYVIKRVSIDIILYDHFVWCTENYIKEFQTFCQFWQQQITSYATFEDGHVCQ